MPSSALHHNPVLVAIVNASIDAMIATDGNGRILLFNTAAERMFRCAAAEAIGQRVTRFLVESRRFDSPNGRGGRAIVPARRADGEAFAPEGLFTHVKIGDRCLCTIAFREPPGGDEPLLRLNDSLEQQAKRIARALHDEAGQLLTAAHIALAEAARDVSPAAREHIHEATAHLDEIEEQLRRLAHEIRPRILDDIGLVPALEFLAEGVEKRRGVSVWVNAALDVRLAPLVETTIYRLVQEALTNATKHGRGKRIVIGIERTPQAVRCAIADDGVGFDLAAVSEAGERGLGLAGIRQQLATLGGTLAVDSAPGRGTELTIVIPLEN